MVPGAAASPSVAGLTVLGWQEPIGCGGVAVFPNDVVVVDQDGQSSMKAPPAGTIRPAQARRPETPQSFC